MGEGLAQGALFLAPETRLDDRDGRPEQLLGARCAGDHRGTGGQGDEGMQVGGLAGIALAIGAGEPAIIPRIAQRPCEQCRDTVLHQRQAARDALHMRHGEAMGHARSVQGFGDCAVGQSALGIEAAKTARQARGLGEGHQALALGDQPGVVNRGVEPTAEREIDAVHHLLNPCQGQAGCLSSANSSQPSRRACHEGLCECHRPVTISVASSRDKPAPTGTCGSGLVPR